MKETSEEIVKRLQELTRKRAEDRKKKWKEDLVFRMKNDNPMYNPVYKAKVIDKLKGNKNAKKKSTSSPEYCIPSQTAYTESNHIQK